MDNQGLSIEEKDSEEIVINELCIGCIFKCYQKPKTQIIMCKKLKETQKNKKLRK